MDAVIIVFPGSNREVDAVIALEKFFGKKPKLVWHADTELPKADLIMLPGGFSYGDYLRTGAMAAQSPIMREVAARAKAGTRVLGVCNGFQILCEAQLLPGILLRNAGLKFICKKVKLLVENAETDFTRSYAKGQELEIIAAHGDGNYFAEPETLRRLEGQGQVVFRYLENPNGSLNNIAGICNENRNVLGLMPHPENAVEPLFGGTDGAPLFASLAKALS